MAIWDDYQNNQYSGNALDAAMGAAQGQPNRGVVTTSGTPQPAPQQPTPIPPIPTPQPTPSPFPAANPPVIPNRPNFATNAPINTLQQNIPIGGFGLGALQGAGYSRSPLFNFGSVSQSQPTLAGYKWTAGTGGVTGGNNAQANYSFSNGSSFTGPANSQYDLPQLGATAQNQPGLIPQRMQYPDPILNGARSPTYDPSVGALDNAKRSLNAYGQNVITPSGGGQIISGTGGPNFGSLYGSTQSTNSKGQRVLNTPSGGQAIGGKSLRKPMTMAGPGQTWNLGGWY